MDKTSIYDLELHQSMDVYSSLRVIRVPGGWMYIRTEYGAAVSVFVPFHNEFQEIVHERQSQP